MKKSSWITIGIILLVIIFSILTLVVKSQTPQTDEEIIKCIGQDSELYIQLGCSACKTQEEMFGENKKYLKIIDCWFEKEKCYEIIATPSWKINEEIYKGVQSIEELRELTGC